MGSQKILFVQRYQETPDGNRPERQQLQGFEKLDDTNSQFRKLLKCNWASCSVVHVTRLVDSNIVRFQNARDAETQVYDATFGKS